MKVSELSGFALDWAVAKCEGCRVEFNHQYTEETKFDGWWQLGPNHWQPLNKYSTGWAQGGPIIEREGIHVLCNDGKNEWTASSPRPNLIGWRFIQYGPTPLIAAMRCYVASRLGEEIDVPEALLNQKGEM
jgi:hypothetical protein